MILERPSALSSLHDLPAGAAGVRVTLGVMGDLIRAGRINPQIRGVAERLVEDVPGKNYSGEVRAIHRFVRDDIRYTQDVLDVETLKDAVWVLKSGHGDCDDKVILLCSLLESIGHQCRIIAVGFGGASNDFSHVYAETKIGPRWIALETTEPVPMGWRPENPTAHYIATV